MKLSPGSTLVIALGGNALLRRGEANVGSVQRANIANVSDLIAPLLETYSVIITHGNGPQVGLLAAQTSNSDWPLDVIGAESEGMIGYVIEQELGNRAPKHHFATLLSQVAVDKHDEAFKKPTKPIGPVYLDQAFLKKNGWSFIADGKGWRRVVASPHPLKILGLAAIETLIAAHVTVICLGGGGIPVTLDYRNRASGTDAVIDKDLASSLLALDVGADALIMLTDVDGIYSDFGTPKAKLISRITPSELSGMNFDAGSMRPKVDAAVSMAFAGKIAMIGALGDLADILSGNKGTWVVPDPEV